MENKTTNVAYHLAREKLTRTLLFSDCMSPKVTLTLTLVNCVRTNSQHGWCKLSCHAKYAAPKLTLHFRIGFGIAAVQTYTYTYVFFFRM